MRGLTRKEIEEELDAITDDQVYDSEEGGDDDAEDILPVKPVGSPCKRRRTSGTQNEQENGSINGMQTAPVPKGPNKNSISREKTDDDDNDDAVFSDDSLTDPDYAPREEELSDSSESCSNNIFPGDTEIDNANQATLTYSSSVSDSESEADIQIDNPTFVWDKHGSVPQMYKNSAFQQPYGPKVQISDKSPSEIFFLFFTTAVWEHIVHQTNLYANNDLGINVMTTVEEMKALFGILIIMGFHSLPSMRLYWSNDVNFHVSRVAAVMTLKRFLKLIRCIHLNDNSKAPARNTAEYDKLYKVRPLINFLSQSYQSIFSPSRYLSIDESMIRFKGRSSMKQYMPMKPIKRGFKVWVVACAVSGFMLGFDVYTGKTDGGDTSLGLGERVVLNLGKVFQNLYYCLFFDNFFTSLPLLKMLLERGLFACGTIRSTRKHFPKIELKTDKELAPTQSDFVHNGDISVSKWMDKGKKAVCVASSFHDASKLTTAQRTNREGKKETVPCPDAIASYNMYMGGVDKFDQYLSPYSIGWKSRRWWLRIFYYFVDCTIVNSYIMYKENCNIEKKKHCLSHLEFRSQLANELIDTFSNRKKSGHSPGSSHARKRKAPTGRKTVVNAIRFADVGRHLPEVGTRRRCAHCSTQKFQKRSTLCCKTCNVALCKECFLPFHKSK